MDISNIILLKNTLQSRVDLSAFAKAKSSKGNKGLYKFVLNRGDKKVNDLLHLVWEMETAKQEQAQLTRLEGLREQLNSLCVCNGEWLECELEILEKIIIIITTTTTTIIIIITVDI